MQKHTEAPLLYIYARQSEVRDDSNALKFLGMSAVKKLFYCYAKHYGRRVSDTDAKRETGLKENEIPVAIFRLSGELVDARGPDEDTSKGKKVGWTKVVYGQSPTGEFIELLKFQRTSQTHDSSVTLSIHESAVFLDVRDGIDPKAKVITEEKLRDFEKENLPNAEGQLKQIPLNCHVLRSVEARLLQRIQAGETGYVELQGNGGLGKSSILYRLAKSCGPDTPVLYLDMKKDELSSNAHLARKLGVPVERLPQIATLCMETSGKRLNVIIDALDHVINATGLQSHVMELISAWSEQGLVICARRPGEPFKSLGGTTEVLRELSKEEIEQVFKANQVPAPRNERTLEWLANPLLIYLWIKVKPSNENINVVELWRKYWEGITTGQEIVRTPNGVQYDTAFISAKRKVLNWLSDTLFDAYSYQVGTDRMLEQVEDMMPRDIHLAAFYALKDAGVIKYSSGTRQKAITFFHDNFFEFTVARRLDDLDDRQQKERVQKVINELEHPARRRVIDEIALFTAPKSLEHEEEETENHSKLHNALYDGVLDALGFHKERMEPNSGATTEKKKESSGVAWGITFVLQDLVGIWEKRLILTLNQYNPELSRDRAVASTIASVFCKKPREGAIPELINSLNRYSFKRMFLLALSKFPENNEARSALHEFCKNQMSGPSDADVFAFVSQAFVETKDLSAVPLLQNVLLLDIREDIKDTVQRNLNQLLSIEKIEGYSLSELKRDLRVVDEFRPGGAGPSNWEAVVEAAHYLRRNWEQDETVAKHRHELLELLQNAASHDHEEAGISALECLGEVGNQETSRFLLEYLRAAQTPRMVVASTNALYRIAERRIVDGETLLKELNNEELNNGILPEIEERIPALKHILQDLLKKFKKLLKKSGRLLSEES